jgi:sensor histidine kinase regulating citrate/malate metabolism
MEWQIILAIVLGIPIILIPVVLIWYINVSGIYTVIRETQKRRAARKKRMREAQELAKEPAIR